jgi:FlaA1/EpsC-like NDP-sugar epimerase
MVEAAIRLHAAVESSRRVRWLPAAHLAVDSLAWVVSLAAAEWLRYDFDFGALNWGGLAVGALWAVVLQGVFGRMLGVYGRRWRYGSFDEVLALAVTVVLTGLMLTVVVWTGDSSLMPKSVPLLAMGFTVSGTVAARSFWRLAKEKAKRPDGGAPLVVVGAGDGAYQIVRTLNTNPNSPYRPVAMVDDDPLKARLRIEGVRVEGVIDELAEVARQAEASTVLLAIPTADSDLVQRVNKLCDEADLRLLVLPPVHDMFGTPTLADIRPVEEADLLGRRQADIDPEAVKHYITGKRVLVTGAGGSIGSELCRQLARFEPEALVMLDRDESGLHAVQLSIEGRALLNSPNLVLADIRDAERMREVFEQHRPHVVFHAAALKHLPLLEAAPAEAWKTNVVGTNHVLDAAEAAGVEHFVNISTDKAADPTSVLGYSKRITERLTAHRASIAAGNYVSVRFGNVLGSRGSVLTAFRAQAEAGGPITVTHPEVTRYFMTVEEAVRLTIYAGAIGDSGEVMVLDMGEPVRIADVAARFANQHTPPLEIVYTGLRPGEKLHEDLIAAHEDGVQRVHELISHVAVGGIAFADIEPHVGLRQGPAVLAQLCQLGGTAQPTALQGMG